ncbi:D-alanyl-D-alanine carboxypeptidase [Thermosynechococcaceae cyanobacterium BACA0444]|uniref:D-alanyl-D-alanine carboxypeptidase n=1 Tax=Pseudocalidococcus azoricus BACA0444 TaxID=2918990 RepID=A0AAE4FU93_9CYAN|nr:D-alanyl-D-alanine carboxypeptidase [Pseudocalidococcus azoricus]MDS3862306.1 D-alanyl-D-alanine carboxypeptidase [Pseudocalidococcus azoricus BACA0444]
MWELLAATNLLWEMQTGQPPLTLPQPQALVTQSDPQLQAQTQAYLKNLASLGFSPQTQGIWLQAGRELLVNHNGEKPLSAASVTKVATSLVVLEQLGTDYRFTTQLAATGPIQNGVLRGDLVVIGGGDPLLVWEEGAAIGHQLNQLGIREVQGNLVVVGPLMMNFETDPLTAGVYLRQAMDTRQLPDYVRQQAQAEKLTIPAAQVRIQGTVIPQTQASPTAKRLFAHQSLPLIEIVRQMNIYSNNDIAEALAGVVGGGPRVAKRAIELANLTPTDIQLINGSGLGDENRVSPRAACGMLDRLQAWLVPQNYNLADVLPMAGRDKGTVEYRQLPKATLIKTGTLWNVSALVGVVPTRKFGPVCFAIVNNSTVDHVWSFREQQDQFVQALSRTLGTPTPLPPPFLSKSTYPKIGDLNRNLDPAPRS